MALLTYPYENYGYDTMEEHIGVLAEGGNKSADKNIRMNAEESAGNTD